LAFAYDLIHFAPSFSPVLKSFRASGSNDFSACGQRKIPHPPNENHRPPPWIFQNNQQRVRLTSVQLKRYFGSNELNSFMKTSVFKKYFWPSPPSCWCPRPGRCGGEFTGQNAPALS